ncbi:MAG: hypothetical protein ACYC5N_08505, partial [Endomicrobiales bacterium]
MKKNRIDLSRIKTVSLKTRPSKVQRASFAGLLKPPLRFGAFWDSLPDILAGKNLKNLVKSIVSAREKDKPVILTFGAHVIKC